LAFLRTYKDFDILKDIELIWALKLKVGSKHMPLNQITGFLDRFANLMGETRLRILG
jgi:hypothetical protein